MSDWSLGVRDKLRAPLPIILFLFRLIVVWFEFFSLFCLPENKQVETMKVFNELVA